MSVLYFILDDIFWIRTLHDFDKIWIDFIWSVKGKDFLDLEWLK